MATIKESPDLIVLDAVMPKMDGFEMLRNLKANPETRDIPVIMLIAKEEDAEVFRGWMFGSDSYLTKPFNPLELLWLIQRILVLLCHLGMERDKQGRLGGRSSH
jgi:DNA-binding response OmpR family regulator